MQVRLRTKPAIRPKSYRQRRHLLRSGEKARMRYAPLPKLMFTKNKQPKNIPTFSWCRRRREESFYVTVFPDDPSRLRRFVPLTLWSELPSPTNKPNLKPHLYKMKSSTYPMVSKYKEPKTAPSSPQFKPHPASASRVPLTKVECGDKAFPVAITARDTASTDKQAFPPLPPGRKVSLRWLIARAAARQVGEGNPVK